MENPIHTCVLPTYLLMLTEVVAVLDRNPNPNPNPNLPVELVVGEVEGVDQPRCEGRRPQRARLVRGRVRVGVRFRVRAGARSVRAWLGVGSG